MKNYIKKILGVVIALALVIVVGLALSSDSALKATDGDENILDEELAVDEEIEGEVDTETVTDEAGVEIDGASLNDVKDNSSTESEEKVTLAESEGQVTITSNIDINEPVKKGQKITLTAMVDGFENTDYTFQWSRSLDGLHWEDIEGANGSKYTFTMDEDTNGYQWQVRIVDN